MIVLLLTGHFIMGPRLRRAVRRNALISAELDRLLRETRGAAVPARAAPGIRMLGR